MEKICADPKNSSCQKLAGNQIFSVSMARTKIFAFEDSDDDLLTPSREVAG
jgi:hypothetical protein